MFEQWARSSGEHAAQDRLGRGCHWIFGSSAAAPMARSVHGWRFAPASCAAHSICLCVSAAVSLDRLYAPELPRSAWVKRRHAPALRCSAAPAPQALHRGHRCEQPCPPCFGFARCTRTVAHCRCIYGQLQAASPAIHASARPQPRPNPSLEPRPNGGPPGPRSAEAYHALRGPGVPPSAPSQLER